MSNKELGDAIRKVLKQDGIPSRAVSVSVKDAGYSTSVRIRIKDIAVGMQRVEKLLEQFEKIRYDERSGEILEGANTYVIAEYDYGAMAAARATYMDQAREIIANHKRPGEGTTIAHNEKAGTRAVYFYEGEGWIENKVEIFSDDEHEWSLRYGRYSAYNEYVLAEALAIFNAHGSFAA